MNLKLAAEQVRVCGVCRNETCHEESSNICLLDIPVFWDLSIALPFEQTNHNEKKKIFQLHDN